MTARRSNTANVFETTLSVATAPTDLTFTVATTVGGPATPCYLVFEPDKPTTQLEIIYCDGTFTGTTFVTSGIGNRYLTGSAAASGLTHPIGSKVRCVPVQQLITDIFDYIETVLKVPSAAVGDIWYAGAVASGVVTPARLGKGGALKALAMNQANTAPAYASGYPLFVFADATARNAAITSPTEGLFAWLTGSDVLTYYTGSAWANYSAAAASGLLAVVQYAGGSGTYSTSATTLAAIDTTNLRATFVAPASGKVLVRLSGDVDTSSPGTSGAVYFGVLDGLTSKGAATAVYWNSAGGSGGVDIRANVPIYVTGLTPGTTYNWDFAWKVDFGTQTARIYKDASHLPTITVESAP